MKYWTKLLFRLFALIAVSPLLISYYLFSSVMSKSSLIMAYSQLLSLVPGKTGSYLRLGFLNRTLVACSTDSMIYFGTIFSHWDTSISDGVYIGANCNIGSCTIERNVLFGSGVNIMSGKRQHDFSSLEARIQDQGGIYTKVVIGEDTWIGNGALVMANVGKKCIVGAGSVVTDDIPDFSIVAGNPAKVVRSRTTSLD